jgi:adenine-specific DNA-methyltransferase
MLQQLKNADNVRQALSPGISPKRKAEFGQFMTPSGIASFMASLFPADAGATCRLLDAGAGVGALSCAFLDRWITGGFSFESVEVFAYEIDAALRAHLIHHLKRYSGVVAQVFSSDFIEAAAKAGLTQQPCFADLLDGGDLSSGLDSGTNACGFTHAILNPPYKKINSKSTHRLMLRKCGIETVNLYSAFTALAVELAAPAGQIVAIIPRSFCNGPYYRPFRDYILSRAALRQMHLFHSRSKAFKDDDVLQENIIIRLERGGLQSTVTVSTSTDDTFNDIKTFEHPFDRIVFSDDPERFIHVPTSLEKSSIELSASVVHKLVTVGVKVSTGPVVDFRLRDHLCDMPEPGTVPLLYPAHFSCNGIEWPKPSLGKPNAIRRNSTSEKWLYPAGFYCVVRRFSSKEEKRRIVASVVDPSSFHGASMLGFENHLNVFHEDKAGLPPALAHGLAAFLNTTAVDESFRRFNGHTQVNATDLRLMKYPSRNALLQLGVWAMAQPVITQVMLDEQFGKLTQ